MKRPAPPAPRAREQQRLGRSHPAPRQRPAAGSGHDRVYLLLDQAVHRRGRARRKRDAERARDERVQRHHARRRKEHADHRREDDERHYARLGELVELLDPRNGRLACETGRHYRVAVSAGDRWKTAKFSITSATSKSAAPPLCATASASGRRARTLAIPSAACAASSASSSPPHRASAGTRRAAVASAPRYRIVTRAPTRWVQWMATSASCESGAPAAVTPSSRSTWKASAKFMSGSQRPWQAGKSGHASAA